MYVCLFVLLALVAVSFISYVLNIFIQLCILFKIFCYVNALIGALCVCCLFSPINHSAFNKCSLCNRCIQSTKKLETESGRTKNSAKPTKWMINNSHFIFWIWEISSVTVVNRILSWKIVIELSLLLPISLVFFLYIYKLSWCEIDMPHMVRIMHNFYSLKYNSVYVTICKHSGKYNISRSIDRIW